MTKTTKKRTVSSSEATLIKIPVKKVKLLPIIVLLVISLLAYSYYRFGIVATVNGKPISRFAYLSNLQKQDQKQTIKQMANEALVYQEALKNNIVIEKSVIDSEIASVEAQIKTQGQTLEAALASEGMTRSDLEEQIRLQKIVEKLANPNLDISQSQIDEYLASNKSMLPTTYTPQELQDLARTQLTNEAKNSAIDSWFSKLQENSEIIIR